MGYGQYGVVASLTGCDVNGFNEALPCHRLVSISLGAAPLFRRRVARGPRMKPFIDQSGPTSGPLAHNGDPHGSILAHNTPPACLDLRMDHPEDLQNLGHVIHLVIYSISIP